MKILDRYILKQFLVTYFFVVAILISVICVVDYTEHSDDFIKHNLTLGYIFKNYYLNYIPYMANTLSPIAVFIAVVFMTSRLASRTEVVAILSGGVSFARFLMPYLVGATFLGVSTFYLIGWIIPEAAQKKVEFQVTYLKSPFFFDDRDVHFRTSDTTYVYMSNYTNWNKTGYKFTIEKIKGEQLLSKLSAERIVWDSVGERWHLDKYRVMELRDGRDSIWYGENMDTVLGVTPKYFENSYSLEETMTFDELEAYIQEQKLRGVGNIERFLNTKYERYAYPFAIVLLTVMGVLVSSKKSRRGTGFQIAMGFLLAFIYILFVMMSRSVASGGAVEPMLAAWLPNITFFLVTVGLYFNAPK